MAKIESESALISAGGTFKVSCWNGTDQVINNETVTYSSGAWTSEQTHIWPDGATLTFFAHANAGTGASNIAMANTGVTMSYTVPNSEEAQTDVLVGTYSGTGGSNGTATINFSHPMTNVIIKKGTLPDGYVISDITLSGIKKSGSLSFNGTASTWSGLGTDGSFTKEFSPAPGTELAGYMFIPQETEMTISVSITGETDPFTATTDVDWSAGKCYTYTLNIANPEPGDHNLSLDVSVQDMTTNDPVSIVVE